MSLENEMSKLTKAIELLCAKLGEEQTLNQVAGKLEETKTGTAKDLEEEIYAYHPESGAALKIKRKELEDDLLLCEISKERYEELMRDEETKTEPAEQPAKLTTKDITEAARKAVERGTSNRTKAKEIIGKYGAAKAAELKDEDLEAVLEEIKSL